MRPMGNIPNVTPGIMNEPAAVVVAAVPAVDTNGKAAVVALKNASNKTGLCIRQD
jgi:hypothetical protein